MSIPPLVCSTPPPPDQCEDDKDPEDFDLQYNLSQEDDDENYDYGSFSTYNNYQSSISNNDKSATTAIENLKIDHDLRINVANEGKLKLEEDPSLEDLNLKLDQVTIEKVEITSDKGDLGGEISSRDEASSDLQVNIPGDDGVVIQDDLDFPIPSTSEENVIEDPGSVLDHIEKPLTYIDELNVEQPENVVSDYNVSSENDKELASLTNETVKELEAPTSKVEGAINDDFEDFDDFQFASPDDKPTSIVDSCDNPWDNKATDDNEFGDFKANFDENVISKENSPPVTKIKHSNEETVSTLPQETNEPEDDDFGDFDDFKSSAIESTECATVTDEDNLHEHVPVLNLQPDNEHQLMDSINKVLSSIFEHEIPEPENEFEFHLDSLLGETWGHLLEIEVRQPYMVNWNNSLGQKTLLKSLSIDSRNILFGPKWSYNMPKYAPNLSVAPLQPQKQVSTSSAPQTESLNRDKPASKPAAAWNDPFNADGQESSNPESESSKPVMEIGPTDLDVFEAAVSSKSGQVYSSTLNVQPLRQISLPDTHIFTPTDSETPRSKTIHYDNTPTVLLPPPVENIKKQNIFEPKPSTSSAVDADNEYWEFQDFKGASEKVTPNPCSQKTLASSDSVISPTTTNKTYATQLLQPIKVDTIMPTLNWPDPGEVKHTFDDFSDFVSNSSWPEKHELSTPVIESAPQKEIGILNNEELDIAAAITQPEKVSTPKATDSFDDDFDTFQSALPPPASSSEINFSNLTSKPENISPVVTSQNVTSFDFKFPPMETPKSDTISFASTSRNNNNLIRKSTTFPCNLDNPTTTEFPVKSFPLQPSPSPMIGSSLLQPTPASSCGTIQNQQKSAQILQPLSLESYSQINWPNPGIDLQDLSRFNPVETLQSLKSDLSANSHSKSASPVHNKKSSGHSQASDDDIWGEFVSSKPKQQQPLPQKPPAFVDDDEWTDFVSSPSVKPQNGLNTISLNVHTNLNLQKSSKQGKFAKRGQMSLDIPTLNYITPKSSNHKTYNDRHFQNL